MCKLAKVLAVMLMSIGTIAVAPLAAQANTTAYGTESGGVFKAFTTATKVMSTGSAFFVSGPAGMIEFTTCTDTGTLENIGGVGHSSETIKCSGGVFVSGPLAGCKVANTFGEVTDEVQPGGVTVRVTVVSGFELDTTGKPAGCPTDMLGNVTSSVTGHQAPGSNVLVFESATGLTFLGEPATLSGSEETVTKTEGDPVVIN